eukprot:8792262-Pyramimonas_sp.AAC.1
MLSIRRPLLSGTCQFRRPEVPQQAAAAATDAPVLRQQDTLEGKLSSFVLDDGDMSGLGEYQELSEQDLKEAESRKQQLSEQITSLTTTLFDEVQA